MFGSFSQEFADHLRCRVVFIIDDEDHLIFRIFEFEQGREILPQAVIETFARGDHRYEGSEGAQWFRKLGAKVGEEREPADQRTDAEIDQDRGKYVENDRQGFSNS